MNTVTPDPRAVAEAKRQGSGWVYQIEGDYGPSVAVPPQSIVGAWKVVNGEIAGELTLNPNYVPGWQKKSSS